MAMKRVKLAGWLAGYTAKFAGPEDPFGRLKAVRSINKVPNSSTVVGNNEVNSLGFRFVCVSAKRRRIGLDWMLPI